MIKAFKVQNLNKKYNFDFQFQDDLNIFTGKNGSGKTTLLKMMWYVLSGNIKNTTSEVYFDSIYLKTAEENIDLKLKKGVDKIKASFSFTSTISPESNIKNLEEKRSVNALLEKLPFFSEESIFLPTFRRIEGGFLTESRDLFYDERENVFSRGFSYHLSNEIAATRRLSRRNRHQFIASVSTNDVVYLLTKKYAEISEAILKIEKEQSDFILQSIANSSGDERGILFKIKNRQQETNLKKETLLKSFTILSDLIKEIFEDKGIKITDGLSLGDATTAIISDKLSAGEKQMLSFLCYCMFAENSIIFIDEPELSLHPDWQRLLIPTLLEIAPTNQFFIATHSPFIYAKYPDKEIILDKDKGGA